MLPAKVHRGHGKSQQWCLRVAQEQVEGRGEHRAQYYRPPGRGRAVVRLHQSVEEPEEDKRPHVGYDQRREQGVAQEDETRRLDEHRVSREEGREQDWIGIVPPRTRLYSACITLLLKNRIIFISSLPFHPTPDPDMIVSSQISSSRKGLPGRERERRRCIRLPGRHGLTQTRSGAACLLE